ncbi:MAG TPA: hypothetical protein ACFCUC_04365 [Desulfobacterales bacterium]
MASAITHYRRRWPNASFSPGQNDDVPGFRQQLRIQLFGIFSRAGLPAMPGFETSSKPCAIVADLFHFIKSRILIIETAHFMESILWAAGKR